MRSRAESRQFIGGSDDRPVSMAWTCGVSSSKHSSRESKPDSAPKTEKWGSRLGGDEERIGRRVEGHPEQLLRVEPQDRPAVGVDVPDLCQGSIEPQRRGDVRHEHDAWTLRVLPFFR